MGEDEDEDKEENGKEDKEKNEDEDKEEDEEDEEKKREMGMTSSFCKSHYLFVPAHILSYVRLSVGQFFIN